MSVFLCLIIPCIALFKRKQKCLCQISPVRFNISQGKQSNVSGDKLQRCEAILIVSWLELEVDKKISTRHCQPQVWLTVRITFGGADLKPCRSTIKLLLHMCQAAKDGEMMRWVRKELFSCNQNELCRSRDCLDIILLLTSWIHEHWIHGWKLQFSKVSVSRMHVVCHSASDCRAGKGLSELLPHRKLTFIPKSPLSCCCCTVLSQLQFKVQRVKIYCKMHLLTQIMADTQWTGSVRPGCSKNRCIASNRSRLFVAARAWKQRLFSPFTGLWHAHYYTTLGVRSILRQGHGSVRCP